MASVIASVTSSWESVCAGPKFFVECQPDGIDVFTFVSATEPTVSQTGDLLLANHVRSFDIANGEYLWVKGRSDTGNVVVTDHAALTYDSRKNVNVVLQDQTTQIVDLLLARNLDVLTIDANTEIDDKTVTVSTTGVVPVVGNYVCLKEDVYFYQGRIQTVTPVTGNQYTITLNTPIDYAFTTNGGCALTSVDMNVDGSVTPVVFSVSPAGLSGVTSWDITRMILTINDDSTMDDGKFGGLNTLTNGVVFRVKYNGERKNIFTARNNGDFRMRAYDVSYLDATLGPSGQYTFSMRRTFNGQEKNGVVVRLTNDDTPDEFQAIVQDDLTGLTRFNLVIQGHVTDE